MKKHALLTLGTAVAGWTWLGNMMATHASPDVGDDLYPDIAYATHASWPAAEFFHGYFAARSLHNANWWAQFFHPTQAVYYDATLGEGFVSRPMIEMAFKEAAQGWPVNATSYPLQILGDTTSAIVYYVNTPEMFGAEIRCISAIDFLDDKVTRQVDYWDGRRNPVIASRSTDDKYPHDLGLDTVEQKAASELDRIANQLNTALSACDAKAATALFSYDAVFEDITLRTREEGQLAISRYLKRALPYLPYGPGASLRHVLGSIQGGGYEWQTDGQSVRNGITMLELNGSGSIIRLTTVWDGSRMSDSVIRTLAMLSIET